MSRTTLFVSLTVTIAAAASVFAGRNILAAPDAEPAREEAKTSENQEENSSKSPADKAGQSNDQGERTRSAGGSRHGQWKNADHCFATCVALANQEEVVLAEMATKKSENDEVKKFAAMMAKDHQAYLTKLQRFAPEAAGKGYLGSAADAHGDKTEASKTARNEKPTQAAGDEGTDKAQEPKGQEPSAAGARPGHAQGELNITQIERELAQQCLASATEKLNEKSGAEFDKCFVGMQIAMHAGMRNKLIVFQRHASKELGEVLAAGQKTTEHHLAQAEELMKALDHGPSQAKTGSDNENKDDKKSK